MQRRPPPLANIITVGVQNFDAQRHFYRQLGWPQAFDSDDFAVFELRGALLALFPIDKLGSDAHAQPEPGRGGIRFSIIINVDTPEEVDELAARVRQAGGKLTKNPTDAEFFVGRDAYFADPEGNYWEIACAPRDNPVVSASLRAAGMAPRPKRLKHGDYDVHAHVLGRLFGEGSVQSAVGRGVPARDDDGHVHGDRPSGPFSQLQFYCHGGARQEVPVGRGVLEGTYRSVGGELAEVG